MQFAIDFIGARSDGPARAADPGIAEGVEPVPATLGTRSVAGGERDGFIQEEQFRIAARGHHRAPPPFKFQQAGYPASAGGQANDLAVLIMQNPAPISHESSA
jgi:hypothetical protein